MHYSPEGLIAFVEAASLGSFSAAARKLNKSQSTISTAIANLEADLNLTLFDRNGRQPVLTAEGRHALSRAQEILAAGERLEQLAIRLSNQTEPRLTIVISDTYQTDHHEILLKQFEERYPDLELECLIAEDDDVISSLQKGRAHLALVKGRDWYPADIGSGRLAEQTSMAIYVCQDHPLAKQCGSLAYERLKTYRELRLNSYERNEAGLKPGIFWSAANYLLLLEMAEQGFGWTTLPRWLVRRFDPGKTLVELNLPGWPKMVSVDVIWSRVTPPGPAGSWLRDRLLKVDNMPLS